MIRTNLNAYLTVKNLKAAIFFPDASTKISSSRIAFNPRPKGEVRYCKGEITLFGFVMDSEIEWHQPAMRCGRMMVSGEKVRRRMNLKYLCSRRRREVSI